MTHRQLPRSVVLWASYLQTRSFRIQISVSVIVVFFAWIAIRALRPEFSPWNLADLMPLFSLLPILVGPLRRWLLELPLPTASGRRAPKILRTTLILDGIAIAMTVAIVVAATRFGPPAAVQDRTNPGPSAFSTMSPEGRLLIWVIAVIFALTILVCVDRAIVLGQARIDKEGFLKTIRSQISRNDIDAAIDTCQTTPAPMTRVISAGLRVVRDGPKEVEKAMDEATSQELPELEKRLGYLAMLGNLATLAGLLGTITGLIKAFAGVAGVDPSVKATMLSNGISQAMNYTAFGLGTGIIGLVCYAFLNGVSQRAVRDILETKDSVIRFLSPSPDPSGTALVG